MARTYRLDETYLANYQLGPRYEGPWPSVPDTPTSPFLGLRVKSRIGVAAGLLLNSRWIQTYARLGFDLLTYKTVRSAARPCYPLPNWVRLKVGDSLPEDPAAPLYAVPDEDGDGVDPTWAVCFGIPSMAPDVWRADVERAKRSLRDGQLLNVSVVGTPAENGSLQQLSDDFAQCAVWARDSGADMVEANFSCPNVCTAEGQIYHDPETSRLVATAVRERLGQTPLLIKIGYVASEDSMAALLGALDGVADAVVLVNGIQRRVLNADGQPTFGTYERVGIVGRAIHKSSVAAVARAVRVIRANKLNLSLAAVGGVCRPSHFHDYIDVGADAVFLGSSPMVDPQLAVKIKDTAAGR